MQSSLAYVMCALSDFNFYQFVFNFCADGTYINFVNVAHETNSIICTFVNRQDRSRKSCNATYTQCDGAQQPQIAHSDTSELQLVLKLMLSDLQTKYCYTMNASNDTVSVLIEGSIIGGEYDNVQ